MNPETPLPVANAPATVTARRGAAATWLPWTITMVAVAAAAVLVTLLLARSPKPPAEVNFESSFQAVLLQNGAVYFGRLSGYGTPNPVLTEVYYMQNVTNPESKQPSTVLVKRGRELHTPNRMFLNPAQIVLVEPVGANSRVAQLIAESRR